MIKEIVFLIVVVFITWNIQSTWFPTIEKEITTDTLRVDVPYEVEIIEYRDREVPVRVTEYITEYVEIETVRVETDTVYISVPGRELAYHANFLTQFPDRPKFLGASFQNGLVEITGLKVDGTTEGTLWNVGSQNWVVGSDGEDWVVLETSKRAIDFGHSFEAGWLMSLHNNTPYLEYQQTVTIFGLPIKAKININQNPFVSGGIEYEF